MPPTWGASGMREIDGGFPCNVVFAGGPFEVKIKERLGHRSSLRETRQALAISPTGSVARRARYAFSKSSVEVSCLIGCMDV